MSPDHDDRGSRAAALAGIRILELVRAAPGELPGMMLADMGAQVLKIEPLAAAGAHAGEDPRRTVFAPTNRNKRSIALDLKHPEGRGIFLQLAAGADVVIEGFRPGTVARLGIDYPALQAINPRLVYCSMSGYGQDGPYRLHPGHDVNYLAMAGALGLIGAPDGPPVIPLNLVADFGGASLHAALGIMFALFARERSGVGQHVDIAYFDTTLALLAATPNMRLLFAEGYSPGRGEGVLGGTYPFYTVYRTRDDRWLSIGCTERHFWENFCRVIERPDLARFHRRPEHFTRAANAEESAARDAIAAIVRTRDRDDWYETLIGADVCVGKVNAVDEVAQDPQVQARGMVVDVDHPVQGAVRQFGVPIKLSGTPGRVQSASPLPGEHTRAVLLELGASTARIDDLLARGVAGVSSV
ncbi:MAG: CaiB/BaiF CoA transferase family protein [Gammaproteobacteria bacterium]